MLKSFTIRNYKSIIEAEVPMTFLERKAPNGYKDYDTIPFIKEAGERLIPMLLIYGANASGKSNVISAFALYLHIINENIQGKFFPNKLSRQNNSTSFEISFVSDNKTYTHELEYNASEILNEKFFTKDKVFYEISKGKIIRQSIEAKGYGIAEFENILEIECSENKHHIATFLPKICRRYPGLNEEMTNAFNYLMRSFIVLPADFKINPESVLSHFRGNGISDNEAVKEITDILQKIDIGICRIELKPEDYDISDMKNIIPTAHPSYITNNVRQGITQRINRIISYHKDVGGNEINFDFFTEESAGTQKLFIVIGLCIIAVKFGRIIIWDELDASIHPFILKEILSFFKSKRYNKTGAQLISSLHDPYVLESPDIRVSDFAIIDKTERLGTSISRGGEFNLRNINNFRKQYLAGHFGGVPEPCL